MNPGHRVNWVTWFLGHWVAGSQNVTQFHVCSRPIRLRALWNGCTWPWRRWRSRQSRGCGLMLPMPCAGRWEPK